MTMTTKEDFLSLYEVNELNILLDDIYAGFLKSERGNADENETAFLAHSACKKMACRT
jgi:hypothetical protein